jgi:beta-hydroxylase
MFINTEDYSFTRILESNHEAIRTEFEALAPEDLVSWPEKFICQEGWDVFGLMAYGSRMERNCQRCPATMRIAESIPGLTTIGFSVLQKHTEILPHCGYTDKVYRCHLGLIVPEECGLRVGEETRQWKEGKVLIFKDAVEHSAWNRSDSVRVVLLLDFLRNPNDDEGRKAVEAIGDAFQDITGTNLNEMGL